jgi:hypothetical protein
MRRATPSFLGRRARSVCVLGVGVGSGGGCCRRCRLTFVGGCFPRLGVRSGWLVWGDLGECGPYGCLVGGMHADFQCAVDERLALCIQRARDRGTVSAAETIVCNLCEDAVRICGRLAALVRRRKPTIVRSASSVAVWVRLLALVRATAAACSGDRGGPIGSPPSQSLIAALAQLSKKA